MLARQKAFFILLSYLIHYKYNNYNDFFNKYKISGNSNIY